MLKTSETRGQNPREIQEIDYDFRFNFRDVNEAIKHRFEPSGRSDVPCAYTNRKKKSKIFEGPLHVQLTLFESKSQSNPADFEGLQTYQSLVFAELVTRCSVYSCFEGISKWCSWGVLIAGFVAEKQKVFLISSFK